MSQDLVINGVDMQATYGMFLTERSPDEFFNLSELLKPAPAKPYVAVEYREEDGERLPDVLPSPRLSPREFQLYVALVAPSPEVFATHFQEAMTLLRSGWLELRTALVERTYRVYYLDCSAMEPLTSTHEGEVVCRLKLRFREPVPRL